MNPWIIVFIIVSSISFYGGCIWTMAWINQLILFLGQMINKEEARLPPQYIVIASISWTVFYAVCKAWETLWIITYVGK